MRSSVSITCCLIVFLQLGWISNVSASLRGGGEGSQVVDRAVELDELDATRTMELFREDEEEVQRFLGDDVVSKPKPKPHKPTSGGKGSGSSSSGSSGSSGGSSGGSSSTKSVKSPPKQSINLYLGIAAVGAAAIVAAYSRNRRTVVTDEPEHPLRGSLNRRVKAFEAFVNRNNGTAGTASDNSGDSADDYKKMGDGGGVLA